MKKVEIIMDGVRYLQRFEPNERYAQQARGIQTSPHTESEFTPIWSSDPKSFDLITAGGYLKTLLDWMRWGQYDEKKIEMRFFDER